jgi:DNA (cytosine-5)-methyltransferase 1
VNYLDLFSGIGGFALGAYWAGWRFDRHYFSEIDPWCCRLYQQRFPDAVPLGDITKIDGRRLVADSESGHRNEQEGQLQAGRSSADGGGWIITGGFPCQDISVAGKGAGITGARSGLWFEYARLIGEIRPRYVVVENVAALLRRGIERVLGDLASLGYDAEWSSIRASCLGAPHKRERIFLLAYPGIYSVALKRKQGDGEKEDDIYSRIQTYDCRELWESESGIHRVVDGIPDRVHRLKGLGNSIVPQIAELIFRQLKENMT